MPIITRNLKTMADWLQTPFVMESVVEIDHFGMFLYLSRAPCARHAHATQDELFYAFRGAMTLDTDWGETVLQAHELAVVPRGMGHQSGAVTPAVVAFFRAQSDPERRNGHGRLLLTDALPALPKHNVEEAARALSGIYRPAPLAQVDEMSLRVMWGEGASRTAQHFGHDVLWWVRRGEVDVETLLGSVHLSGDELLVIPRGTPYRLHASRRALLLTLIHDEVSPEEQNGAE
jgi:mannose-6-phosphate isomerase-like protein (cupin superfamily)